jgi:hypothetical protein
MGRSRQFPPPGLNNPPQFNPEIGRLLSPPQIDPEVLRKLEQTRTIPPLHFPEKKPVTIAPKDGLGTALRWIGVVILLLAGAGAAGSMGGRDNRTKGAS